MVPYFTKRKSSNQSANAQGKGSRIRRRLNIEGFQASEGWLEFQAKMEDFSLYSKFGEAMMRSLQELNFNVEKKYIINKKQTSISDFFLKQ